MHCYDVVYEVKAKDVQVTGLRHVAYGKNKKDAINHMIQLIEAASYGENNRLYLSKVISITRIY